MAEWATPDKKKRHGVEPAPIVAPIFVPHPVEVEVEEEETERELVPARRR